jgi:hypothetical protein
MRTRDFSHGVSRRSGRDGTHKSALFSAHLGDKPVIWFSFGLVPMFVGAPYPFLEFHGFVCEVARVRVACLRFYCEGRLLLVLVFDVTQ